MIDAATPSTDQGQACCPPGRLAIGVGRRLDDMPDRAQGRRNSRRDLQHAVGGPVPCRSVPEIVALSGAM